jgi:hypothetical protein
MTRTWRRACLAASAAGALSNWRRVALIEHRSRLR